jgi:hypothetical protein
LFCSRVLSDPRRLCVQLCNGVSVRIGGFTLSLLSISLSLVYVFLFCFSFLTDFNCFILGLVVQLLFFSPSRFSKFVLNPPPPEAFCKQIFQISIWFKRHVDDT